MNTRGFTFFILFCVVDVSFGKGITLCGSFICGPNAYCQYTEGRPTCTCLQNLKGYAYFGCAKCWKNEDCPLDKACINNECKDPCHTLKCGNNAECKTYNHEATCTCLSGYIGNGNKQNGCIKVIEQENKNLCTSSTCGSNAICNVKNDVSNCFCPPHVQKGDPWRACYNKCLEEHECPYDKVCINDDCKDPCSEINCGLNAECKVSDRKAWCSCLPGYSGNPHTGCANTHLLKNSGQNFQNPCRLWPCGENATCKLKDGVAQCFCLSNFPYGNPYKNLNGTNNCYECIHDTNCADNKACLSHVCTDPCLRNYCDVINAECRTLNHKPQCMCLSGFTYNPTSKSCVVNKNSVQHSIDPCHSSSCGLNAICNAINGFAVCSCKSHLEYLDPYRNSCYECLHDTNCADKKVCINNTCRDPCLETVCTIKNTECKTLYHESMCVCIPGHEYDHQIGYCTSIQEPFQNRPCGSNAKLIANNDTPYCSCPSDMAYGNPHVSCFECLFNFHCADNKACVNNTCTDPCLKKCGTNAKCETIHHEPQCTCLFGYTGNPYDKCTKIPQDITKAFQDPCIPSPCSWNEICHVVNGAANCTCPKDRPYGKNGCYECLYDSHCADDKYCKNNKCRDPCRNLCGSNTNCTSVNHRAHCNCITGYTGDPFKTCYSNDSMKPLLDPCVSSPCGLYAICTAHAGVANCSCPSKLAYGNPYLSCFECLNDSHCADNKTCINHACENPCPGNCELIILSSSLPVWQIALISIIVIMGVIAIIFFSVKLYRKCQKQKDLTYSYPTVPVLSHYATRALVTANKRLGEKNFLPSLPPRPRQQESDYDYADLRSLRK